MGIMHNVGASVRALPVFNVLITAVPASNSCRGMREYCRPSGMNTDVMRSPRRRLWGSVNPRGRDPGQWGLVTADAALP